VGWPLILKRYHVGWVDLFDEEGEEKERREAEAEAVAVDKKRNVINRISFFILYHFEIKSMLERYYESSG